LAHLIGERHRSTKRLFLLGVANGGVVLARKIGAKIPQAKVGVIDISFHRDDIYHHPIPKEFAPTSIPGDVQGATIILVDDVLFSGRTIKAALDELFDHGRPEKVELAILVDRGGRRMPFAPDFLGLTVEAAPNEKVVVTLNATDPSRDEILIRPLS
jgi:pyrimidine operon attenuation protein/uracil phosphoribosyltransferase